MRRAPLLPLIFVLATFSANVACKHKKPAPVVQADPTLTVRPDSTGILFTWIDEKGDFHVEQSANDVPLLGRDAVRVSDPNQEGTGDRVFVADLRTVRLDGSYDLKLMKRSEFEAMAVLRRTKAGPTLPDRPTEPDAGSHTDRPVVARPAVIIYGAEWCGPCHQAADYLRKKGIQFVEKDIDNDEQAAKEMRGKLAKSGLHGGSIPVLDVRGKILVGFDPRAVDSALGTAL